MASNDYQPFNSHRSWEDWTLVALGILTIAAPWIVSYNAETIASGEDFMMICALVTGIALIALGVLEYASLRRSMEFAALLIGAWLFAAPHALGFSGETDLASMNYFIGFAVVLLSVLELWQDWKLSDDELSRHGR